jgi:hypothetical protein
LHYGLKCDLFWHTKKIVFSIAVDRIFCRSLVNSFDLWYSFNFEVCWFLVVWMIYLLMWVVYWSYLLLPNFDLFGSLHPIVYLLDELFPLLILIDLIYLFWLILVWNLLCQISIVIPPCIWAPFVRNMFFHPFTLSLCLSWSVRHFL